MKKNELRIAEVNPLSKLRRSLARELYSGEERTHALLCANW